MDKNSTKNKIEAGIYRVEFLPDVLSSMASYVQQCINNGEDISGYYKEIIQTGLFQDSEGKIVEYDSNTGTLRTSDDY